MYKYAIDCSDSSSMSQRDPIVLVSTVGSIWFHDTSENTSEIARHDATQVVDLKPNGRSLRDEPSVFFRAPVDYGCSKYGLKIGGTPNSGKLWSGKIMIHQPIWQYM